jgi:hypothetical protein
MRMFPSKSFLIALAIAIRRRHPKRELLARSAKLLDVQLRQLPRPTHQTSLLL